LWKKQILEETAWVISARRDAGGLWPCKEPEEQKRYADGHHEQADWHKNVDFRLAGITPDAMDNEVLGQRAAVRD